MIEERRSLKRKLTTDNTVVGKNSLSKEQIPSILIEGEKVLLKGLNADVKASMVY